MAEDCVRWKYGRIRGVESYEGACRTRMAGRDAYLDLSTICKELATVKYKWFKVGIHFFVPYYKLKEFEKEDDPFTAVVNYCLEGNVAAFSWKVIVSALAADDIGESGLAETIRMKYCVALDEGEGSLGPKSVDPTAVNLTAYLLDVRTICNELSVVKYKFYQIGIQLGIPHHKLMEFKQADDPMAVAINYWLKGNVEGAVISWESIVAAIQSIHVGESGLAKRMCNKYCQGSSRHLPCQGSVVISSHDTTSDSSSVELPPVELGPYFPYLTTEDEPSKQHYQFKLNDEATKIKRSFAALVFDLQRSIEDTSKLEDVVNLLKFYDEKNFEKLLKNCHSVTEVFDGISRLVSFFDYDVIKLLTRKLGSKSVKKKLEKYKQKFQEFSKRRVCECPSDAFGDVEKSEKVYAIKIDKSFDTLTADELQKLNYKMNKILGHELLRLLRVEDGCLQLIFRTLKSNSLTISAKAQQELREAGVLSVTFGDNCVDISTAVKSPPDGVESESGFASGKTETTSVFSQGLESTEESEESKSNTYFKVKDLIDPRIQMMLSAERKTLQFLSPLHKATIIGDLQLVKMLVEDGANPLDRDINNDTLLHHAARWGELDILEYLVEDVGCNPATEGWHGSTALHSACEASKLSLVLYLIEKCQLDPTELDKRNWSPLVCACRSGDLEIIRYLIDHMCEYMKLEDILRGYSEVGDASMIISADDVLPCGPLTASCIFGHLEVVKFFVEECNSDPSEEDGNVRVTPLEGAVIGNHIDIVDYFIKVKHLQFFTKIITVAVTYSSLKMIQYLMEEFGCDPTTKDADGRQLIHYAAGKGRLDIVQHLVEKHSCDFSAVDDNGFTPLHAAAECGHLNVVQYLTLEHDCNPLSIYSIETGSSLHCAAHGEHIHIVSFFVKELKHDPNIRGKNGLLPVHYAAHFGNLNLLKFFITELHCDPLSQDNSHHTLLHTAAQNGHLAVVKYLVQDLQCDPNTVDVEGNDALFHSVIGGHIDIIQYLVKDINMDVNIVNHHGRTPLSEAALEGHLQVVSYLLASGSAHSDADSLTPLHYSVSEGHLDIVKYLMDSNQFKHMYTSNPVQKPLLQAVSHGHLSIVKYLIDVKHCSPQIVDMIGNTPLHMAALHGQEEVAKYLISHAKCDLFPKNMMQKSPLHYASQKGNFAIVKSFIAKAKHADVDTPDEDDLRPIHYAANSGNLRIVRCLVEELHCNPNVSNKAGFAPLHFAANSGHLEVVRYLVDKYDTSCKVQFEATPLHLAASNGHLEVVRYLVVEKNSDPFSRDTYGCIPLHMAAFNNKIKVVMFLAGTFPSSAMATNQFKETPLHAALRNHSRVSALYLMVHMYNNHQ